MDLFAELAASDLKYPNASLKLIEHFFQRRNIKFHYV